jgi:hypothetical protein
MKPARFALHSAVIVDMSAEVVGNDGMDVSGFLKLNALVMSPTV